MKKRISMKRLSHLLVCDIHFQMRYGFYFLYLFLTIVYILLVSALHGNVRNYVAIFVLLTDPAAMGMFFMGAIVLLEKSDRVLNSLAVSPVTIPEYIAAKCISLGLISTLTAVAIGIAWGNGSLWLTAIAIFMGSIIFSLCGLIVGANVLTLNQYVILTAPFEVVGILPAIAYEAGFRPAWMLLHPGCMIVYFLQGHSAGFPLLFLLLLAWCLFLYTFASKCIRKMFLTVGGIKL